MENNKDKEYELSFGYGEANGSIKLKNSKNSNFSTHILNKNSK